MNTYRAIKELSERLKIIDSDFGDQLRLRSYAEALTMAIAALKAEIPDKLGDDNIDNIDNIDADIQAADTAAEDMEDNRGGLAMKILVDILAVIGAVTVASTIGMVIVTIIDGRRGE